MDSALPNNHFALKMNFLDFHLKIGFCMLSMAQILIFNLIIIIIFYPMLRMRERGNV